MPGEPDRAARLRTLAEGELELIGRLPGASNATFLARIAGEAGEGLACVYKPVRGERPLDDFPTGTLARREVAAFLLSEYTGWNIVPPSVLRAGPLGEGMVQQWIEIDGDVDVVAMVVDGDARLRPMCVFDALANNADRKAGHLLPVSGGHVFGVDHGICFAVEPKLRTVLWTWHGRRLAPEELAVVRRVCDGLDDELGAQLGELLTKREVRAAAQRAQGLLAEGRFPQPDPLRPAVPWPPF